MNNHKNYVNDVYDDIKSLYNNTLQLNADYLSEKFDQRKYSALKYAYMCNGVYLNNVIEELKKEGIKIDEQKIRSLNFIVEYLSQDLDMKEIDHLDDEDLFTIQTLTMKYQEILPLDEAVENEFLEDDQL